MRPPHRAARLSLPTYFLQKRRAIFFCACLFLICLSGYVRRINTKNKPTPLVGIPWEYDLAVQEPMPDPTQTCSLPRFHPFDPSLLPYLKEPRPLFCKIRQPFLTFVDDRGRLRWNHSALEEYGYGPNSLTCNYKSIRRPLDDDFEVDEGQTEALPKDGVQLKDDFVAVTCYNFARFVVYDNIHCHVTPLNVDDREERVKVVDDRFGVFFLGIDSVSRMAFIRHLPKTYRYLTEVMGVHVMRGMSKIGDNTFPNLAALLTGRKLKEELIIDGDFGREWPLVWNNFRRQGYATLFAEDQPRIGLFNYQRQGLRRQPTHHYLRPFWLAVENTGTHRMSSSLCFGGWPKHRLQLDYSKDFLVQYARRGVPVYGLSFFVELSHDYLAKVSVADEDFSSWLEELHANGLFNRTVLVVFSDHGHRFDAIRETLQGRLEERLPFFAIHTPPDLVRGQRDLLERLATNSGRLTSLYDGYYTAIDLLRYGTRPGHKLGDAVSSRGKSLFGVIPANRTCSSAGIPDHYCVCEEEEKLSVEEPVVKQAAESVMTVLNLMVKDASVNESLCHPLTLLEIRRADRVKANDKILVNLHDYFGKMVQEASAKAVVTKLRLVIETNPNHAVFEATVIHRLEEGFTVDQDISRINKYGDQSWCIEDPVLKKYCQCRDQKDNLADEFSTQFVDS